MSLCRGGALESFSFLPTNGPSVLDSNFKNNIFCLFKQNHQWIFEHSHSHNHTLTNSWCISCVSTGNYCSCFSWNTVLCSFLIASRLSPKWSRVSWNPLKEEALHRKQIQTLLSGRYKDVNSERRYWVWKAVGQSDGLITQDIKANKGES